MPENPERIVALAETDIDALVALGVEPVAITDGRGQTSAPRYLLELLSDDVISTGTFYQPNLEVVLGVNPDLILFAGFADEDVLAQLNAIAPVYNGALRSDTWQTHLTRIGEVVGLEDEAATVIEDYDARVADLRERLGEDAGQFIVSRWAAEGPQIMAPTTPSSLVLIDLGLQPPTEIPELQEGHPHSAPLSLETLELIDVDWAFLGTLQGEGEAPAALEAAIESPLFQALEVVQSEHVFYVDGSLWTSTFGAVGANTILSDVEAAILGE